MTISASPLQCQLSAWTWNPPDGKDKIEDLKGGAPPSWGGAALRTFSGDLHGDAARRGPEVEAGVACAQGQPGAAGVPLEAAHSRRLLQHGLQAHLLRVPNPDHGGHVVYGQKIEARSELLGAQRAANS